MTAQTPASDGPGGEDLNRAARAALDTFHVPKHPLYGFDTTTEAYRELWRDVARAVLAAAQPPAAREDGAALDESWIAEAEAAEARKMAIPWNDEPMPETVLDELRRMAQSDTVLIRAVQEIERLRQQVGTLRMDRRENYATIAELRLAARPATPQGAAETESEDERG